MEAVAVETSRRGRRDPMKLLHDSSVAFLDASRSVRDLRNLLLAVPSVVLHPGIRRAARDYLDALDRLDQLGVLAREVGVQL